LVTDFLARKVGQRLDCAIGMISEGVSKSSGQKYYVALAQSRPFSVRHAQKGRALNYEMKPRSGFGFHFNAPGPGQTTVPVCDTIRSQVLKNLAQGIPIWVVVGRMIKHFRLYIMVSPARLDYPHQW
jgi:hypothetical protein